MLILGIDPGTIRMGYGVMAAVGSGRPDVKDYGVISLPQTMPLEQRLYQLYTHVVNLIGIFRPEAIAVEEPFVGRGERRFAGPAIAVGQAQAVVLIGAAGQAVPVFTYAPAQVKRLVADHGAATKEQMQQIITSTLELAEPPDSDAADALAIALCHLIQGNAETALEREILPGRER